MRNRLSTVAALGVALVLIAGGTKVLAQQARMATAAHKGTFNYLRTAPKLMAQEAVDTTKLAGNWAYSLGPKTLFGLHLERDPARPDRLRGYVVVPEDFNCNSLNGTYLQFSNISAKSEQHPVASFDWKTIGKTALSSLETHPRPTAATAFQSTL